MIGPMRKQLSDIVSNGIFYTPEAVARKLVSGAQMCISASDRLRILDPSCGESALLKAAEVVLGASNTFHGCDLFVPQRFPKGKNWRFNHTDFFDYPTTHKFDLVTTNPPFIRSSRIPRARRRALIQQYSQVCPLSELCDFWVYFLLKSLEHLQPGGAISAIIPWAFLEAEFAHSLRIWLAQQFASIKVLVLRGHHFDRTNKRVLLLWMSGFGRNNQSIQLAFSGNVEESHDYFEVPLEVWTQKGLIGNVGLNAGNLLERASLGGFRPLKELATVSIGVVTGANDYFVLAKADARKHGFPNGASIPILTSVDDASGTCSVDQPGKVLLQFTRDSDKRRRYIAAGVKQNLHLRSHSRRRSNSKRNWYHVDPGPVPDAFFTYRASTIPYLVLNPDGFQCTNALHKVFFDDSVTDQQKKWLAVSVLSDLTQLSLEHLGRHYGNGILKIEPSALKSALVFCPPRRKINNSDVDRISDLQKSGHKQQASTLATSIIRRASGLSSSYWREVREALDLLRQRRLR